MPFRLRKMTLIIASSAPFDVRKCEGSIVPFGGDWLTIRANGVGVLDVRASLKTEDGALIYVAYSGILPVLHRTLWRDGERCASRMHSHLRGSNML